MTTIACGCGCVFEATDANFVGINVIGVERLGLYNCPCGSTRAIVLREGFSACGACCDPIEGVKVWANGWGAMHEDCAEYVLGDDRHAYSIRPLDRRPPSRVRAVAC